MLILRRTLAVAFTLLIAVLATQLAMDVFFADGVDWVDYIRITLSAITAAWIAWGASIGLGGLLGRTMAAPPAQSLDQLSPQTRTAILVPVYNEDPEATLTSAAAMAASLAETPYAAHFDLVVLSDTRDEEMVTAEQAGMHWLRQTVTQEIGVYYRHRENNEGKKAGNVGDFVRRYGGAYTYMLILDADSLMEGRTILTMLQRMEADPELGLLQSLPQIISANSWFARSLQFSAALFSPIYTRGLARTQGREGPFWGHNALVRTQAFAESCGLPELSGKPPFGGHILSHDYVEAALLAREGWKVRVDADLEGSYEQCPQNVIDFAKRDRRWCQGNLQHARLLTTPRLKGWSRFTFVQGIMAYAASPLWMLLIICSIIAPLFAPPPEYFPSPYLPAIFPHPETALAITLLVGIFGLLIGPKLLIALQAGISGRARRFGGFCRAFWSTWVEIIWSSLLAPITLMYQSRSVLQVLAGLDGGWPASDREGQSLPLIEATRASWWVLLTGVLMLLGSHFFAPNLFYWLLPIALPQILAPLLISLSSTQRSGHLAAQIGLFMTPEERQPTPVMQHKQHCLSQWQDDHAQALGPTPEVAPASA